MSGIYITDVDYASIRDRTCIWDKYCEHQLAYQNARIEEWKDDRMEGWHDGRMKAFRKKEWNGPLLILLDRKGQINMHVY